MVKVGVDLSGVKIPKKVGGVKVPKKLRKKGKELIAKANSAAGREAIAAGLTVAATVIAAKVKAKEARQAAHGAEGAAPKAPSAPGTAGIDPQHELGDAIAAGIGALQRFLVGRGK